MTERINESDDITYEPIDITEIIRPYGPPIDLSNSHKNGLSKADRTLPYTTRYQLKEIGRERVRGIESITSRAQIGVGGRR